MKYAVTYNTSITTYLEAANPDDALAGAKQIWEEDGDSVYMDVGTKCWINVEPLSDAPPTTV